MLNYVVVVAFVVVAFVIVSFLVLSKFTNITVKTSNKFLGVAFACISLASVIIAACYLGRFLFKLVQ